MHSGLSALDLLLPEKVNEAAYGHSKVCINKAHFYYRAGELLKIFAVEKSRPCRLGGIFSN